MFLKSFGALQAEKDFQQQQFLCSDMCTMYSEIINDSRLDCVIYCGMWRRQSVSISRSCLREYGDAFLEASRLAKAAVWIFVDLFCFSGIAVSVSCWLTNCKFLTYKSYAATCFSRLLLICLQVSFVGFVFYTLELNAGHFPFAVFAKKWTILWILDNDLQFAYNSKVNVEH